MKRHWEEQELAAQWSLAPEEIGLLRHRTDRSRLGFAVLLKFFQIESRFPTHRTEIPAVALAYLADQLEVSGEVLGQYDWGGRNSKRDREQIRSQLGFRPVTVDDAERLVDWLHRTVLPDDHHPEHLHQAALSWCRNHQIEPPTPARLERMIRSALKAYEDEFFATTYAQLSTACGLALDALLGVSEPSSDLRSSTSFFRALRSDPGRVSLKSVLQELAKLERIRSLGLPDDLFASVSSKVLHQYRLRASGEHPSQLKRHPAPIRHTLVAAFCWQRYQEIIDGLVDLLIQVVHRMGVRAERKVVKTLLEDLRTVHGKTNLLYRLAEAAVDHPDGVIKDVLYPVVGEQTLQDLVREFKSTGLAYQKEVHTTLRGSYSHHYRRMLPLLLDALTFRSNNVMHRPVIDALAFLQARRASRQRYFLREDGVPIEGVVRSGWQELILERDRHGIERINRINYEICVLQALRERLRCKEIWIVGADRYRNPDEDLPSDFERRREEYYAALNQPQDPEAFVSALQQSMTESLSQLDQSLPGNPQVSIRDRGKGRLCVSPLDPQPEPVYLSDLHAEVTRRWPMTGLLDVLKETDLRVDFTRMP